MAQWIRHLTTNQGIPGSSPGKVEMFFASQMTNAHTLASLINYSQAKYLLSLLSTMAAFHNERYGRRSNYTCHIHGVVQTSRQLRHGLVAQWIRHLTTNQGIVGSNPTGDVFAKDLVEFLVVEAKKHTAPTIPVWSPTTVLGRLNPA